MPAGVYLRTEETLRKMRERKPSEEHKKKISASLLGIKRSEKTRKKMSKSQREEGNPGWKGDSVGYSSLHRWVRRYKGSPLKCENCAKEGGTTMNYQWANVDNKYKRDLDDFTRLCSSCHKKYDLSRKVIK